MVREAKRVRVTSDAEIARVLEDVCSDGEARIVQKDGRDLAAVVPVTDVSVSLPTVSREAADRALAAAGSWKDLVSEDFGEKLVKRRHESPPSSPVEW